MDIYSTEVLNGVVETIVPNPQFFLSNWFTRVETSDVESIFFDKVSGRRRISPFVSPVLPGQVVQDQGYETQSFKPAYIKDKRVFDPNKQLTRLAGERIGGSLTPEQRLEANVQAALTDQLNMRNRRLEVMAAEVLRFGRVTIEGEFYPKVIVDFRRNSELTIALTGSAKWNASPSISPIDQIEAWADLVFQKSGVTPKDVVMTKDVWDIVKLDIKAKGMIDRLVQAMDNNSVYMGPRIVGPEGCRLVGLAGEFRFWVYADRYVDPIDNSEKDMLPRGSLMLLSDGIEGIRHFGALKDIDAGIQAREFFVKSWTEHDPSVRYLLAQSAPLLVPYRPDASLGASVL